MKLKYLKGFSLIELMIVIAIIGILASIAVPAYQNYIYRARTSELLALGRGAQNAINEYMQEQGQTTPNCPTAAFGATGTAYVPPAATPNVSSVNVTNGCVVQVTPNTNAGGAFASLGAATSPFVTLTPTINADGSVTWVCHSNPGSFGTGGSKYAPSTCQ